MILKLTIDTESGTVRISRNLIKALNDPNYVRLLIDRDLHKAAIQPAKITDRSRMKVPYDNKNIFSFLVYSKALTESLSNLMGWDQKSTYRINGELIDDDIKKMIVFNLNDAEHMKHHKYKKDVPKYGDCR